MNRVRGTKSPITAASRPVPKEAIDAVLRREQHLDLSRHRLLADVADQGVQWTVRTRAVLSTAERFG
jgi:hypothetical protein